MFRALIVRPTGAAFENVSPHTLPPGDVLIRVLFSSLNYKDGLAVTGRGKILRSLPMVPGIDLAGSVLESASPDFAPGDPVLVTGCGIGESHWGGYAELARVPAAWVVPLPALLDPRHAMALGTAGFTAMLCVQALEAHGLAPTAPVVVTGAAGGVGSIAIALLSRLGYAVTAITGRPELHPYLESLGASAFLTREDVSATATRPLASERWAGAIDTVGGPILAGLFPALQRGASVAACGLAGGNSFSTSVFPFILRGVNLLGINCDNCTRPQRLAAWQRLASLLPGQLLDSLSTEIPLDQVFEAANQILAGAVRGRTIVRCQ
jgi:acrylyl-CoA reductase (NADPH)